MIIYLINYFGRKAPLKSWRAQKNYSSWKSEIQIKVSFDLFFMDLCMQILDCLYFKLYLPNISWDPAPSSGGFQIINRVWNSNKKAF